ncbi:MAG TPA: serine/threonine-protein kinase, partial [Planctomycetota bacterium]|nr:serine/threonine-protein kinase [Planctomycetota bacterium]
MDERRKDPSTQGNAAPSLSTDQLLARLEQHAPRTSRYQSHGEIARGGMGAILEVWDEDLRRSLAMKVILGRGETASGSKTPRDQKLLARFLEEAQITGQLDHPGIVPVHELGLDSEGHVYFTMKLVKGRELEEIFELAFEGQEDWNETRALGVILKVCEAMAYAHQKNVIHRDLKPANVMVGNFGEVFVMDWGVARLLGETDTHDLRLQTAGTTVALATERTAHEGTADSPLYTMDGDIVGTPAYMPPEQARGDLQQLSARSDVYSIGAMLYHLIARHMPYCPPGEKMTNHGVLTELLHGSPAPLETVRADIPPALVAICEKA